MRVLRDPLHNALRNVQTLLVCEHTGEALAIDPLDAERAQAQVEASGARLAAILCTHHHPDHTAGKDALRAATGAPVLAHEHAPIEGVDVRLRHEDAVPVGALRFVALATPGHTMSHICLFGEGHLVSGDTLFTAGVGNCKNGGDPRVLYRTVALIVGPLPDETVVLPGHDYAERNLLFASEREPGNEAVARAVGRVGEQEQLFTLGQERAFNPFLRLSEPGVRAALGIGRRAGEEDVFLALRALRDRW